MSIPSLVKQAQQAARWFLRRLDTHPLTTSAVTVTGFTTAGLLSWTVLDWLEVDEQQPNHKMTLEEARLRAMIENAQESSWQENLDQAAAAQERFMLPGRQPKQPDFMALIDQRSLEIMQAQHDQVDKEQAQRKQQQQRRPTTQIWT